MMKSVNDILEAVPLDKSNKTSLLGRIAETYNKKDLGTGYRKMFSEEDFKDIVKLERERLSKGGNYSPNNKSVYIYNSNRHLYNRLTYYGGIKNEFIR